MATVNPNQEFLTPAALVSLLNMGAWVVFGGQLHRDAGDAPNSIIMTASLGEESIVIESIGHIYEIKLADLVQIVHVDSGKIQICHVIKEISAALYLLNPMLEKQNQAAVETQTPDPTEVADQRKSKKVLKVMIEFEDRIISLQGAEAQKWSDNVTDAVVMSQVHGDDFPQLNWQVQSKEPGIKYSLAIVKYTGKAKPLQIDFDDDNDE